MIYNFFSPFGGWQAPRGLHVVAVIRWLRLAPSEPSSLGRKAVRTGAADASFSVFGPDMGLACGSSQHGRPGRWDFLHVGWLPESKYSKREKLEAT